MQPGNPGFGGNGYVHEPVVFGKPEKSRYRRGRGLGRHPFRASSSSPSYLQQQYEEKAVPRCTEFDMAYFQSYSHVGIHEEMIKVVVDVGCGTGILSIFCALAGAKRVYAVDASEIAVQASEVVKANNLTDKVIVLHGRVEDVNIEEEVDVIISEWMGYMLLYESMLGSVITARDRWLKAGGLILPSHATLYMAPVTHPDRYRESIDFWRNVYGIDSNVCYVTTRKQCAFEEPCVKYVDCYTVTIKELESVTSKYRFESMMRGMGLSSSRVCFLVRRGIQWPGHFREQPLAIPSQSSAADPNLNGSDQRKKRAKSDEALILSTAPEDAPTHWQQTLIYFYDPIEVQQDQIIEGSITISQSKENSRFLNIHLEYASGGRSYVKESVMR
ncbi:unnamed protein product [Spirodela intermedia]|uniref:Protein arginine N-methyltransferase domain-containing protein n=1 Tax=Spirodela intermedia TaxID=51605 RepID=A0A7I8JTG1_SPIIN|nr:unnamed protein product [Spirodela intermedia]CAA6673394.1 unnamed protein product [Spirodela intermedia]